MAVEEVDDVNEWETVAEESGSAVDFPDVGSQFIGTYLGSEVIMPEGWEPKDYFTQYRFRDTEGNVRTINEGHKLKESLAKVSEGSKVRITRAPDVEMSDPKKAPMKDYRVEVAK